MDVAAVLRQMYPQVDPRIIKATALEHRNDLTAAINFIVDEVLDDPEEVAEVAEFTDTVVLDGDEDQVDEFDRDEEYDYSEEEEEEEEEKQVEKQGGVFCARLELQEVEDQVVLEAEPVSTSVASSGYAVDNETIDQLIEQTKADKQALLDAIEEVKELRLQADEAEAVARELKIRAAMSSDELYSKAAETKETLVRAKQANERRTGDIYGEKAILGTEAKELYARLQQVREEWQKAYNVLEESKDVLVKRIEAAKLEAIEAEHESMRKEEAARKALLEEENALAEVEQESRHLDAEDEACSKLQNFLFEKGSIVDALQGEIAVLNEDVELLKKKIDGLALSDVYDSFQMKLAVSQQSSISSFSNAQLHSALSPLPAVVSVESETESSEGWDLLEEP